MWKEFLHWSYIFVLAFALSIFWRHVIDPWLDRLEGIGGHKNHKKVK